MPNFEAIISIMAGIQLRIYGRVQGVFYRASCLKKAAALGLCGTVKNMADGSVEIRAVGKEELMLKLVSWSKIGSEMSKVDKVVLNDWDGLGCPSKFVISD